MSGSEMRTRALERLLGPPLEDFAGIAPGTTLGDIVSVAGPVTSEGFGGGDPPLWMTTHAARGIEGSLTAWYEVDPAWTGSSLDAGHVVAWIERPIVPSEVKGMAPPRAHPGGSRRTIRCDSTRGWCVSYSNRSGLPTLFIAFAPTPEAAFATTPVARQYR